MIDAGNALGQLTARQAVALAVARAREIGIAGGRRAHGFHFGTAGRYARMMAEQNCVGIALSSTRPLMPAPGGAEALVGNNPIAVALPSTGEFPVEADMALSATAMGKIRLAAAAGEPIPERLGGRCGRRPTTDPAAAIKGMLLPAAGPKGFGLAFVIDLLCGGLSGGAVGAEFARSTGIRGPLPLRPFLPGDPCRALPGGGRLRERVQEQAALVSPRSAVQASSACMPGRAPVWATRQASASVCRLDAQTVKSLAETAPRASACADFENRLCSRRRALEMRARFEAEGDVIVVTWRRQRHRPRLGAAAARPAPRVVGATSTRRRWPHCPMCPGSRRGISMSPTAPRNIGDARRGRAGVSAGSTASSARPAIQPRTAVHEMDPAEWERVLRINLDGVVWCYQAVIAGMIARRSGSIIAFTSGLAQQGWPGASAYAASKAALIAFAKSAAKEIAQHRVRFNLIAPGVIDTPQYRAANAGADDARWRASVGVGQPEDAVGPLMFLLSDQATMTASIISRDFAYPAQGAR